MESASDSFPEEGSFSPTASGYYSPISSASTHDITSSTCHIRNFDKVVDALQSAASRASSTSGVSRYTSVHVLLLQWEFDDLGVDGEVQQLSAVLDARFGFHVEQWRIPSLKPTLKLTQTISSWVEKSDSKDNLFVLYYAGHGRIDHGRQVLWRNIRDSSHDQFAEIKWSTCEDILHEAVSDTLFLLDCCYSAGSASRPLSGFSETIAASGFDSIAPPPGPHSFTATLTKVLRRWASESTAFSVINLHTEILVSLKEIPPQYIVEGSVFEWRRTPVHYIRSSGVCPPSIVLSPLPATSPPPGSSSDFVTLRGSEMEDRSVGASSQPRVILSITLAHDLQRDDPDACHRWLASFPLPTVDIKVEAVYQSLSTVILVSLPVAAWDLLPEIPGCNFVCFATSKNLVAQYRPNLLPVPSPGPVLEQPLSIAKNENEFGHASLTHRTGQEIGPHQLDPHGPTPLKGIGIETPGPSFQKAFEQPPSRLQRPTFQYYEQSETLDLKATLDHLQQIAGKYVDFTLDLNQCTWENVHQELRKAQDVLSERHARNNRRVYRAILDTSSILAPGLTAIPDDLSVLNGGLAIVFSLARHSELNRAKILNAFERIPKTIETAQDRATRFPQEFQLQESIHELLRLLLQILPAMINKLLPGASRNIWKNPYGHWKLDQLLGKVAESTESVRICIESLIEEHIVNSYSTSMAIRDQLNEILQQNRLIMMALNASGQTKTQLLEFWMEQLSASDWVSFPSEDELSMADLGGSTIAGYTSEDLLKTLKVNHLGPRSDAVRIIQDSYRLNTRSIERAGRMAVVPQVTELLTSTISGIVPLSGHFSHETLVGGISPLSYMCALLAEALRQQQQPGFAQVMPLPQLAQPSGKHPDPEKEEGKSRHIVLQYFCAEHTNENDSLKGPQGVVRSLTSQLILSLMANKWVDSDDSLPLPHLTVNGGDEEVDLLDQGDLDAICRLFTALIRIVPRGVPIFCIVDDFSVYESENRWRGDYDTVLRAFRQAAGVSPDVTGTGTGPRAGAGGGIFKLILTSPTDFHWLDESLLAGDSSR